MLKKVLFTMVVLVAFPSLVFAQIPDAADVGKVKTRGSGCHNKTVMVAMSPDGSEVTIMFEDYYVETDKGVVDSANCNIDIPVQVPAGWTVGLAGIDYRGMAVIPDGGEGEFSRQYFFAGTTGENQVTTFGPGTLEFFSFEDEFPMEIRSRPNESVVMAKIHTQLRVKKDHPSIEENPMVAMYTADGSHEITLHLDWKKE